mmetsp:Transcript_55925/g.156882  ORF Transcript_55925/g.156882 Transcript_55925/m.156882 type:complete len:214 (+) Transcript_55925:312-953(+)
MPSHRVAFVLVEIQVHAIGHAILAKCETSQPPPEHAMHPKWDRNWIDELFAILVLARAALPHHPRRFPGDCLGKLVLANEELPPDFPDEVAQVVFQDVRVGPAEEHPGPQPLLGDHLLPSLWIHGSVPQQLQRALDPGRLAWQVSGCLLARTADERCALDRIHLLQQRGLLRRLFPQALTPLEPPPRLPRLLPAGCICILGLLHVLAASGRKL